MASPGVGPVVGHSDDGPGVVGTSNISDGVAGRSTDSFGVFGASTNGVGVRAVSEKDAPALEAQAKTSGIGVSALSDTGTGVQGISNTGDGVAGRSTSNFGVFGASTSGVGVRAVSEQDRPALEAQAKGNGIGVSALSTGGDGVVAVSGSGVGVHARGGKLAGLFEGNVTVNGNIDVTGDVRLTNADCAEDFDIADSGTVEPGTVMVLNDAGELEPSAHPYDRRVAGVVSGAGAFKPGIVLDRRETGSVRQPIGLLGKVWCKVDAQFGAIAVGDLLTTSPTPGHAMATTDPLKAFGAVLGKALQPLSDGKGSIPILITLQ